LLEGPEGVKLELVFISFITGKMGFVSPGARFSKASETLRARKAIFSPSVSKNGEVYTPETSCIKGTSLHIKNMWIKQLCNRKVRDFAMALRARKVSGGFRETGPWTGNHNYKIE